MGPKEPSREMVDEGINRIINDSANIVLSHYKNHLKSEGDLRLLTAVYLQRAFDLVSDVKGVRLEVVDGVAKVGIRGRAEGTVGGLGGPSRTPSSARKKRRSF